MHCLKKEGSHLCLHHFLIWLREQITGQILFYRTNTVVFMLIYLLMWSWSRRSYRFWWLTASPDRRRETWFQHQPWSSFLEVYCTIFSDIEALISFNAGQALIWNDLNIKDADDFWKRDDHEIRLDVEVEWDNKNIHYILVQQMMFLT